MRTVILMKMVSCNNLFYHYVHGKRYVSIPITDKLKLANGDSLYYSFIFTIYGGPARFYYMLVYMFSTGFIIDW
jgi:hypothetical protein